MDIELNLLRTDQLEIFQLKIKLFIHINFQINKYLTGLKKRNKFRKNLFQKRLMLPYESKIVRMTSYDSFISSSLVFYSHESSG